MRETLRDGQGEGRGSCRRVPRTKAYSDGDRVVVQPGLLIKGAQIRLRRLLAVIRCLHRASVAHLQPDLQYSIRIAFQVMQRRLKWVVHRVRGFRDEM